MSLKRLRQRLDLTQAQMGEMLGCSDAYVSQLETGTREITMRVVDTLAAKLGCKKSEILDALDDDELWKDLVANAKIMGLM